MRRILALSILPLFLALAACDSAPEGGDAGGGDAAAPAEDGQVAPEDGSGDAAGDDAGS